MKRSAMRPIRQFKGIVLPSWRNPRPSSSSATKLQWIGHNNTRAQKRNLRHIAAPYLSSKDPIVVALLVRAKALVQQEPDPEFGLLHLIWAAWDAHEQTGETWVTAATYLIEKFEHMAEDRASETTA